MGNYLRQRNAIALGHAIYGNDLLVPVAILVTSTCHFHYYTTQSIVIHLATHGSASAGFLIFFSCI